MLLMHVVPKPNVVDAGTVDGMGWGRESANQNYHTLQPQGSRQGTPSAVMVSKHQESTPTSASYQVPNSVHHAPPHIMSSGVNNTAKAHSNSNVASALSSVGIGGGNGGGGGHNNPYSLSTIPNLQQIQQQVMNGCC
jgi:hypothetical protein